MSDSRDAAASYGRDRAQSLTSRDRKMGVELQRNDEPRMPIGVVLSAGCEIAPPDIRAEALPEIGYR